MKAVSGRAHHQQTRLPANLLFSSRILRQYRRWRKLHMPLESDEQVYVSTALEYDDFQQWLSKQDSGYFSNIFEDIASHIIPSPSQVASPLEFPLASVCQHAMHPIAAVLSQSRCPVCTIEVHLNYVRVLFQSLENGSGNPVPGTVGHCDEQETLYRAWLQSKIDSLRQLSELETLATEELKWSEKHDKICGEDIKTATGALEIYWNEISGCSPTDEVRKEKRKSVSFTADTSFSPGRHANYFLKRSPRYEPGKYTVQNKVPEIDTSISEDSEDYSDVVNSTASTQSSEWVGYMMDISKEDAEKFDGTDEDSAWDDDDSDWTDIESDDYESSDDSYISFDAEEASFVVFSNE